MTVVLDVSAAIEILLKKEKGGVFDSTYRNASWVVAPDLHVSERMIIRSMKCTTLFSPEGTMRRW